MKRDPIHHEVNSSVPKIGGFDWDKHLAGHRSIHGCEGMCAEALLDPTYLNARRKQFLAGELPQEFTDVLKNVSSRPESKDPLLRRAQAAASFILTGKPAPERLQS